jgi:phosphoadenosine phosphosulfate reductase
MMFALEPQARVFALDTHVLFPETYELWLAIEERYDTEIQPFRAENPPDGLWAIDPDRCCDIRKVGPLGRALSGLDAWITGVRREQSPTRANAPKLGWDEAHGLWKANPLADWDEQRVWDYISDRDLPFNPLHGDGYASIGCTHCTRPGNGREGRWVRSAKTECGLHAT